MKCLSIYLKKNQNYFKVHYPKSFPLHHAAKNFNYKNGQIKKAAKLAKSVISISVHEFIKKKELDYMINKIKKFYI